MEKKNFRPDKIMMYFRAEWKVLALITVSGLIYNLGLMAGPWFEGKMAGCLMQILTGTERFPAMLRLAPAYVIVIGTVQLARYIKRFYVRRFANNVNWRMKRILYRTLIHKSRVELEKEGAGNVITKAISDVDDCVEGMRKFTTEIFDTGVALFGYVCMLLYYDWRLALCSMIFPPFSYIIAEKMKRIVQTTGAAYKKQTGKLNAVTLDRITNAITYRVFGCEKERGENYEVHLKEYEQAAVKANIWNAALPPVYKVIAMAGTVMILYFGSENILGMGWTSWDVAAFTTFLACYAKLSDKSSKAAKLFNSVQKANVSWKRIRPLLTEPPEETEEKTAGAVSLKLDQAGGAYPGGKQIFDGLTISAKPGQIIGITGPVACGKSTLGKIFLGEVPYTGHVLLNGKELSEYSDKERRSMVGWQGHDPELLTDSVRNNVALGEEQIDVGRELSRVCLDREVSEMENGIDTLVGSRGVRLSGGQQARTALARTLSHAKPLIVLDDPFAALDRNTEEEIFRELKAMSKDRIILLISHRLYLFDQTDQVIWMENGQTQTGTHEKMLQIVPEYANLCKVWKEGADHA